MSDSLDSLMGPAYFPSKDIKSPSEMKMSGKGKMSTIARNVKGLIAYNDILVSGSSKATKPKYAPLGNKFFLETIAQCEPKGGGDNVTRWLYVDNVPDGNISVLNDMGIKMDASSFKGLIPGMVSSLSRLNPIPMAQSLASGGDNTCQKVRLKVGDTGSTKNWKSDRARNYETHYVLNSDIKKINPCNFRKKKGKRRNIITKKRCTEKFGSSRSMHDPNAVYNVPAIVEIDRRTAFLQLYYLFVLVVGFYIIYRTLRKKNII